MRRWLFLVELLFIVGLVTTIHLVHNNAPPRSEQPITTKEVVKLLAEGKQSEAEEEVENPRNTEELYWKAVLMRSRFEEYGAMPLFIRAMKEQPDSPEGLASACVVGVDLSKTSAQALHYFNAMMTLAEEHPDSVSIHWMAGVLARALTKHQFVTSGYALPSDKNRQVLLCGVGQYEKTLALMAPGQGPVLIHQTLANLLDDLEIYDKSLQQRDIAVSLERMPWSLHAAAITYKELGRNEEALSLIRDAIAMEEKSLHQFNDANSIISFIKKTADHHKNQFPALEKISTGLKPLQNSTGASKYYAVEGDILWNLDRKEEALSCYSTAAQLDPKNQYILSLCMKCYSSLGNYAEARNFSRQALSNEPKNRYFQVWDARMAVLNEEPGATQRLKDAGSFDFNGMPVKEENSSSDPWFTAVGLGDLRKVKEMIPTLDVNVRDPKYNQTALMIAAQNGWEPIMIELLKAKAKTDLVDCNGDTALHYSVQFSQPRSCKLLLNAGAGTDFQDKWHQTPLIMSASAKDWDIVRMLLKRNPNVNLASPFHGAPLHNAAGFGQLNMLKALIEHGADVNAHRQSGGDTPIMTAAKYHHSFVIPPLLVAGADINARDNQGRTALNALILPQLDFPVVRMLLEKGADPTLADTNGLTSITKARLLGYEDLASEMERKSGHAEPFSFSLVEVPNPSLTAEEQNALLLTLPIRLAKGHFPRISNDSSPNNKKSAANELSNEFGIKNASDLDKATLSLEGSSEILFEAGRLSLAPKFDYIQNMLTRAVWKIQDPCLKETKDDSAWTYSRIIYLSELGAAAGLLSKDDFIRIISDASKVIIGRFASWQEFVNSLLLGVHLHEEWEAERYKNISHLILEAGIPWPSIQKSPEPSTPTLQANTPTSSTPSNPEATPSPSPAGPTDNKLPRASTAP